MSAPNDDSEQGLERLLRDLYDTTYDASTLPTPASVWEGVAPRLLHASQAAEGALNHARPTPPALSERLVASDHIRPLVVRRDAPRPWTLPRMVAPVVAAALIVSLLVGVFVALSARRGAQPSATASACQPPAPATTSGVMAVSLNSGDTILLRASDGKQLWRVHTGFPTSTPVVVGGVVYVLARNNDVSALRLGDGTQIWNTLAPSETNYGVQLAEPLVVDCGVVLVNTANGGIQALRASDGAKLWRIQDYPAPSNTPGVVFPYAGVSALLAAGDGVVYALSQRVSGNPLAMTLTWTIKAYRATDGHLLWQRRPSQPDDAFRQANTNAHIIPQYYSQPYTAAVLGHTLYLLQYAAHPSLVAFADQTGAPLWQTAMPSTLNTYPVLLDSLVVAGSYLYLAKTNQVCQLAPNDGASRRCYQTPTYDAVGAITPNALYIPTFGQTSPTVIVSAMRASDGRRLWTWNVPQEGAFFPALIYQRSVETAGVVGVVTSVTIYGVRASDGHPLWSWSPPGALTSPTTDSNNVTGVAAG